MKKIPEQKASKQAKRTHKKPFTLTPPYQAILIAVSGYRFITAEQLLSLLEQKNLHHMRAKLQILCGENENVLCPKYLHKLYQAQNEPRGSPPAVYTLATSGVDYLKELGLDLDIYFRPYKNLKRAPDELDHHLAINEFLICASHLQHYEPRVYLFEARHNWLLKHMPIKMVIYRGSQIQKIASPTNLVPDGYLDFTITIGEQTNVPARVFLEMDVGTHEGDHFKQKIAQYCKFYHSSQYQDLFGGAMNVIVAYATTEGNSRRDAMILWCEEQLQKPLYFPDYNSPGSSTPGTIDADLFRFASLPKGELDPKEVFLSPIWYTPFDKEPQPLLRVPIE